MQQRKNRRNYPENYVEGRHLKLPELKEAAENVPDKEIKKYIGKDNIPAYPQPMFQVSYLKHDTTSVGLRGIWQDEGFKDPYGGSMVWWSLLVKQEDVEAAERRLMEETYPNMNGEISLQKFATSPAFSPKSRLGNFRFIFPVDEVLKAYSEQFCGGGQPVMRVFKTVLYKKEIMYTVVVHGPDGLEDFSRYPLLAEDPNAVCFFRDGSFIWRSEAMCETHRYEVIQNDNNLNVEESPQRPFFYVWDHVAIAFHVGDKVNELLADKFLRSSMKNSWNTFSTASCEGQQFNHEVLKFGVDQLGQNVKDCEQDSVKYDHSENLTAADPKAVIRGMWPEWTESSPEEEAPPRHSRDDEAALPQPPS